MKRVHASYSGNVQGVGFRFTAQDLARKYKLVGWVKNGGDGGVELVVEGEEKPLKDYLVEIKREMAYYVREENISWEPGTGEFKNFQIRF